ncbi:MAG: VWA domain-containing protein, partial [Lachnospiraceae bacterium]|nr:VWA domain-containing protein [Lachnospiraceae bacterium]
RLKFTSSTSVSSLKVSAYVPALEPFVGDVSFLEMPDTTASIRVSPFTVEANAKLVFLSEITLAEAGVQLGNFDYSNSLLQLDGVNVNGLSATLKKGIMWNTAGDRVKVDISGTGELDAHSRYLGLIYTGTVNYDIGWWIINTEKSMRGDVALGLYTTHSGKMELIFAFSSQDSGGENRFYYIDENGKCGRESGVLY